MSPMPGQSELEALVGMLDETDDEIYQTPGIHPVEAEFYGFFLLRLGHRRSVLNFEVSSDEVES